MENNCDYFIVPNGLNPWPATNFFIRSPFGSLKNTPQLVSNLILANEIKNSKMKLRDVIGIFYFMCQLECGKSFYELLEKNLVEFMIVYSF